MQIGFSVFAIKFPLLPKQKDQVNREGCPKNDAITIEMIHFWSMLLYCKCFTFFFFFEKQTHTHTRRVKGVLTQKYTTIPFKSHDSLLFNVIILQFIYVGTQSIYPLWRQARACLECNVPSCDVGLLHNEHAHTRQEDKVVRGQKLGMLRSKHARACLQS